MRFGPYRFGLSAYKYKVAVSLQNTPCSNSSTVHSYSLVTTSSSRPAEELSGEAGNVVVHGRGRVNSPLPPAPHPRAARRLGAGLRRHRPPPRAPAAASYVPAQLQLPPPGRGAAVQPGGVRVLRAPLRPLHRRDRRLHAAHLPQVRARAGDLRAALHLLGQVREDAGLRHPGGRGGPLHRGVAAAGQVRRPPARRQRPRRRVLHVLAQALPGVHDRAPLQDARRRQVLQPRRDGVQRWDGGHRHGGARATRPAQAGVRAGGGDGEHQPQLVLRQQQAHAGHQLHLPRRQRGGAHHRRPRPPRRRQVRAAPHVAHAPRRRRRRLQRRRADGGRGRHGGCRAHQGPRARRRCGAPPAHLHARALRAPCLGAAQVRVPRGVGVQRRQPEGCGGAGARLPARVRAHVHPLRRQGGDRHGGEADGVRPCRGGARPGHAAPVRQHLQQPRLLRAGLLRGQAPRPRRRPPLDARLRHRVQGLQQRLARAPRRRPRRRQPLERLRPPLPRRAARADPAQAELPTPAARRSAEAAGAEAAAREAAVRFCGWLYVAGDPSVEE